MSDKNYRYSGPIGIFTYFVENADFIANKAKFHSFFT
jgi:hypothetical protein